MACVHKFFGYNGHLPGEFGLIPSWPVETLIIGTFNPEDKFTTDNKAKYFYGRSKYFWKILPRFLCLEEISKTDVNSQVAFLKSYKIGLSDLLISINDANESNKEHCDKIDTFLDDKIEEFNGLTWNTDLIIKHLEKSSIKAVYFTKLGKHLINNPSIDTFEYQMRKIEKACKRLNIYTNRLHTPSGQGLGAGSPRENKLTQRWYNENGGKHFPFLERKFCIQDFPFIN